MIFQREKLVCRQCGKSYKIKNGIPILVDLRHLSNHSKNQVQYFENENTTKPDYQLSEWQKSYIGKFTRDLMPQKDSLLVDLGTGTGYMAVELARKGMQVIACDITLNLLIKLQKVLKAEGLEDRVFLVCCSAEELPLRNKIADFFVANAILEHLPHETEAITEIGRICKQHAGMMFVAPLSYWYLNPFLLPINILHDKRIGHLRRYDAKSVAKKFDGWPLTKVYYTGHTMKVVKVLANYFRPIFDQKKIEKEDERKSKIKLWASNICVILKKK